MADKEWVIGVIGGSGLYAMDALENAQTVRVESPWGEASAAWPWPCHSAQRAQ
jgi:5'-methylthioadenosine phosphorylase